MRKYKMKKVLAAILSVVMITLQSGAVFAVENAGSVSVGEVVTQPEEAEVPADETVSPDEIQEEEVSAGDESSKAGQEPAGNAEKSEEPTVSDDEAAVSGDELPAEETEEAVSEDASGKEEDAAARILSYELNGMGESYVLNEGLKWEKEQQQIHNVAEDLQQFTEGVDYVEDEVIFTADSEEFARQVANAYNAELVSCENGVGVLKLNPEKLTVAQAVEAGASDVMANLVPVNPNYMHYLDDPVKESGLSLFAAAEEYSAIDTDIADIDGVADIFSTKGKKTGKVLDHSYWYPNVMKDKYLDPNMENEYQWMHDAIGTYGAWGATMGDSSVKVAVLDTGVNEESSDLKGKVEDLKNWYKVGTKYGSGVIGDIVGHGTHVAGIIAASANGVGVVGVAPAVTIVNVPVFTYSGKQTGAPDSLLAEALNTVRAAGDIRVVNMSLGGPGYNSTVEAAVKAAHDADICVCVSMGNDNTNQINYPVGYDGTIAVVSSDKDGTRSVFSNYGSHADISAPGTDIMSTYNNADANNKNSKEDGWTLMSGTSMACPVVAGACALYISATGEKDPDRILSVMKSTATKAGSGMGAGNLNLAAMIPNDTERPGLTIIDDKGKEVPASTVSSDSILKFITPAAAKGGTIGYVFTFDGTEPKMKDGLVTNGIELPTGKDTYAVKDLIEAGIVVGSPASIKVFRINSRGTASDLYTGSITISGTRATQASGIKVSGPVKVAAGRSVTYKASIKPAYVETKVKWEIRGNDQVTVNARTGKVKVKSNASGSFKVVAVADDTGKKEGVLDVTIVQPASGVTVTAKTNEDVNIPVESGGSLKSVRMYSRDFFGTAWIDNELSLEAKADNGAGVVYSSSKKGVATVDDKGKIVAHKAGNTVITCKADDGSGKKTKIKVKVIVPASSITMVTKKGQSQVAYGKGMTVVSKPSGVYGKPTVKKVEWSIKEIRGYNSDKNSYKVITDQAKEYVKLKNGKVSIKKNIKSLGYSVYGFTVSAKSTDGTKLEKTNDYFAIPPATVFKLQFNGNNGCIWVETDSGVVKGGGTTNGYSLCEPTVKSSNPKVGGARVYYDYTGWTDNSRQTYTWCFPYYAKKKGVVKYTFTLNDGSGKKKSITVRFN